LIYEAENAELSGKAFVANDHSGYSGRDLYAGMVMLVQKHFLL
jgi:hypothetical protein